MIGEQPDTAATREGSAAFPDDLLWHRTQILDLCDALDAARADYARCRAYSEEIIKRRDEVVDRAEAAEAELAVNQRAWASCTTERLAAEARIAAALAIHKRVELGDYLDGSPMPDVCLACQENNVAGKKLWPCPTVRALTEGTGQ